MLFVFQTQHHSCQKYRFFLIILTVSRSPIWTRKGNQRLSQNLIRSLISLSSIRTSDSCHLRHGSRNRMTSSKSMSYSKVIEYLSWSQRLLFRDFDTSSSCFISYFHRHLLSFCFASVFRSFPEDISRIINSTITVKTWKFKFLFFSEVSPLRTDFRHINII